MGEPVEVGAGQAWGLHGSARLAGHHAWVEGRLFEVLGGWVPETPEPEAKLILAAHARHHGWHARLWHDLLPDVAGLDAGALVGPPGAGMAGLVNALAAEATTVSRLAGAFRVVLPRLVTGYRAHRAALTEAAGGPARRVARLVLAEEVEHWQEGEAVLESLLVDAASVDEAAAAQSRLERLLAT